MLKRVIDTNLRFKQFKESIEFEDICKGKKGAILVKCKYTKDSERVIIPIVRTTTKYKRPVQEFSVYIDELIDNVKRELSNELSNSIEFNNAMVEIYDSMYSKMGYHTDQALDLYPNSYICIFSCYEYPSQLTNNDIRKLRIKNKKTNEESEILLENDSIVIFSTETNKYCLHKIILDNNCNNCKYNYSNRWLGITLRLSKTNIVFNKFDNIPYILNDSNYSSNNEMKRLRIANEEERKEFYKYKKEENNSIDYEYPDIDYTISESDLMYKFTNG